MARQIRDLICDSDHVQHDVSCEFERYPACPECGGATQMCFKEPDSAPSTDVYGVAQYSDATGQWHTSQRDKAKVMRNAGFEEAGDPVHGARAEHSIKGSTFSFGGQSSRRTIAEG